MFLHKLALCLGKTVGELRTGRPAPLSGEEILDWIAYDAIHPLPDHSYHAAQICSAIINSYATKPFTPEDFLDLGKVRRNQIQAAKAKAEEIRLRNQMKVAMLNQKVNEMKNDPMLRNDHGR
jgi:hypothetical protein